MTLNGVMAIILGYFTEFSSFHSQLRKSFDYSHQQIVSREMQWSKLHQLRMTDALCSSFGLMYGSNVVRYFTYRGF